MILDRRALIGTGLAASGLAFAAAPSAALAAPLPAVEGDMALGSPKAKVQLVEYASLSCSHCAHFNNDVFPAIKAKYVDTGKVRYVFREFPLNIKDLACAMLSRRIAGEDSTKYFAVVDIMFRQQAAIFDSEDLWGGLLKIGKGFGLTDEQFTTALHDQKALDVINARIKTAGERDKIEFTPTFFVNGTRLEGGQSVETMSAALDKAAKG